MTDSDRIAIGALIVALGSAAFSLVSVWYGRRGLRITANQSAVDLALQADQLFLQWPGLRPYFYDDIEVVGAKEGNPRNRVRAAAEFYLDVMEAIWDHHGEYKHNDANAWREWIHEVMQTAPALREAYDPEWYPSLGDLFAHAGCTKLEQHNRAREIALARAVEASPPASTDS